MVSNGVRFTEVLLSTPLTASPQLAATRAADADVKLEAPRATAIFSICLAAPLRLLQPETTGNGIAGEFQPPTAESSITVAVPAA